MRLHRWLFPAAFLLAACPATAWAGMPTTVLTEWGTMRIGALTFFAFVVLGSAALVRRLWSVLAGGFPRLPPLTYGKSLAGVVLLGMALAFVLTMIAGARELLTPGAWKPRGALYTLDQQEQPTDPLRLDERRENLERLKTALLQYAATHGGAFPADDDEAVADASWTVPGGAGMRYLYVAGRVAGDERTLLACEPAVHPGERLVLYTNGDVASLSSAELRRQIDEEEKR